MKQRPRIYYSESQKAPMWDRWRKGETIHQIPTPCEIVYLTVMVDFATRKILADPRTLTLWEGRN